MQSDFNVNLADLATSYRTSPPREDIVDGTYTTSNRLSVSAGVPYRLHITTEGRRTTNGFNSVSGITTMFDIATGLGSYSEFYDHPVIVAKPNLMFQPSASATAKCDIKVYVNETVPILIDEAVLEYKALETKLATLFTFYLGEETGFDVKNKGVYFTFTFDTNGEIWDPSILQYLT